MKEFVEYIVKNLVDHPDQVRINEVGGTHTLIIELGVEKSDIGKIIGKKGKTINAIRTLLMSVREPQRPPRQSRNHRRRKGVILYFSSGEKRAHHCFSRIERARPVF